MPKTTRDDLAPARSYPVLYIDETGRMEQDTRVAVEEPLTIRANGKPLATLMRTPGEEIPLCVGFLLTEGIVQSYDDILLVRHCLQDDMEDPNVVNAMLRPTVDLSQTRHRLVYSSCGICGPEAIELVCRSTKPLQGQPVPLSVLHALPDEMRRHQRLFADTGGTHAAALFDVRGQLLFLSEDIGRHNALDKTVGKAFMQDADPADMLLMLSGRVSYEMIAKAARVGIATIAAVSAPTSLAVETALKLNQTLIGFLRNGRLTLYSGGGSIRNDE